MKIKIVISLIALISSIHAKGQKLSTAQLTDSIQKIIIDKRIPGGIITVVSKDSILFQSSYGYADIEKKIEIAENDLFKIASITKTFTAMAIMHLVKEGKLSLDDKLKSIAPEIPFTNKWENTHPIKIKHLLEHKAGFSDYSFAALSNRFKETNDTDSFEKIKSLKSSLVSHWKPGLVAVYSNPGYAILGYIIEKKTGKPYSEYLTNTILQPLGMRNTCFSIDSSKSNNKLVNGYTRIDNEIIKVKEIPKGSAEGGLLSNAADMSKFLQYFLNKELQYSKPIIGVDGVEIMERLHSDFDIKNNIKTGYNLALEDRIFGDKEIVFKGNSGLIDGFVSNFIYNRKLDIGVFVSTNLFLKSNRAIIDLVINNYCESKEIENQYQIVNTDLSTFKDWQGEYRELNDTQEIWNFINFIGSARTLEIDGNELVITDRENGASRYKNIGDNAFLSEEYGEKIPTLYLTEYEGEKSIRYYERTFIPTNKAYFTLLISGLIFSLLLLLTNTISCIVQLVYFPFKKSIKLPLIRSLKFATPFLMLACSIYLGLSNLSFEKIPNLGNLGLTSVSIFLLTTLLPFACIWSIYSFSKEKKQPTGKYSKIFFSLIAFANTFICVYCILMGWFAIRLWV